MNPVLSVVHFTVQPMSRVLKYKQNKNVVLHKMRLFNICLRINELKDKSLHLNFTFTHCMKTTVFISSPILVITFSFSLSSFSLCLLLTNKIERMARGWSFWVVSWCCRSPNDVTFSLLSTFTNTHLGKRMQNFCRFVSTDKFTDNF